MLNVLNLQFKFQKVKIQYKRMDSNDRKFRKMNTITHKKIMPDRLEAKYFEFTVQILPP